MICIASEAHHDAVHERVTAMTLLDDGAWQGKVWTGAWTDGERRHLRRGGAGHR